MRIVYVEIEDRPTLRCMMPDGLAIHEGDQCVVDEDRILEFCRVVELEEIPDDVPVPSDLPKVVRCATLQDKAKANENSLLSKMAMETCQSVSSNLDLQMRLVLVRYSFDRAVLMVHFTAEERVDFREMVKKVAGDLHIRVEMRQIGVRDEAGIIGGMGSCGRKLCCCTWLHQFESINVKMAKNQRLSLNPPAISGMCGRLKCCLGYENDVYKDMARTLPREGTKIEFTDGRGHGCVLATNILAQRLTVRLDDERICECCADEVSEVKSGKVDKREDGEE